MCRATEIDGFTIYAMTLLWFKTNAKWKKYDPRSPGLIIF